MKPLSNRVRADLTIRITAFLILVASTAVGFSQSVCLPAPRLLTLMPMGGQVGTTLDVTLTGENLEDVSAMIFSSPKITAKPVPDTENKFTLTIAPDAAAGVYDVRVVSRLGISSPRAFSVGKLPESTNTVANQSLEKATPLPVNSICNAVMKQKAIDYYTFEAKKDQRVAVECAAVGIDSKLTPVVIIGDAKGRDLLVNRTGGILNFTPFEDGNYVIKVHDLTYQGTPRHFYRLAIQEVAGNDPAPRHPSTATVSSMSWPPANLPDTPALQEIEPNNDSPKVQSITLPCDIAGSFFPAADVDTFEFSAKKGETWWVEVASERLGLPTDPFVLVQKVGTKEGQETLTDLAELYDIKSPVKVSSNGYSYDGPPYNSGSPDVLGKVEIKEDGKYRLQVRDLFGGTRNEPDNIYRLIVRKAQPDFSLSAWAVHMTLRNGDRAAFSKPIALRAGGSIAIEVVVIRRDGYDGDIELGMEGLPPGVTATGLKIPAGKSVGHIILTADEDATHRVAAAQIFGKANIGEKVVTRACRLASMEWPVKDAKQEIPSPRLVANIPVSVTDSELASLSVAAKEEKVWEAEEGSKLKIPLQATWREEFSGTAVKFKTYGHGFEKTKEFEIPLKAEEHEVELDLAALKVEPGDYTIAFYGGAVTKYRYNPGAVGAAKEELKKAEAALAAARADQQTEAKAAKTAAEKKLKSAEAAAKPKDIVDIVVSKPIHISIKKKLSES